MDKVTVEQIVTKLCKTLDLKQTQLARMLGINESSISGNLSKQLSDVKTKKTGKRLFPLFLIVLSLSDDQFRKEAIIEGLNEPTIVDIVTGRKESVLEAIRSGVLINTSILIEKASEGVRLYGKKKERANEKFYRAVEEVLLA